MNLSIHFIKFLACLLITNSHYDTIYPISNMATGGSIGNSLFFFVAGFVLINCNKQSFPQWYCKRITRIYPQIMIVTAVLLTVGHTNKLYNLIYPTLFWFINAIMLYYILYYFIPKTKQAFLSIIFLLFIPYFIIYFNFLDTSRFVIESGYFMWIFYFQIMLLGGYWGLDDSSLEFNKNAGFTILLLLISYFMIKILSGIYPVLYEVQFLQHLLTFPIVYLSFMFANGNYVSGALRNSIFRNVVVFFSSITLEIYLVQFYIIGKLSHVYFPINFIIVSFLIILCGYLLSKMSKYLLRQHINKLVNNFNNP